MGEDVTQDSRRYCGVRGLNGQNVSAVNPSLPFEEAIVDASHVVKVFCFSAMICWSSGSRSLIPTSLDENEGRRNIELVFVFAHSLAALMPSNKGFSHDNPYELSGGLSEPAQVQTSCHLALSQKGLCQNMLISVLTF